MAQSTTLTLAPRTWTQLTNADATNVTVQVIDAVNLVSFKATIGAVAPTVEAGSLRLAEGDYIVNTPLQSIFPGAGLVTRLYAYSEQGAEVLISHA